MNKRQKIISILNTGNMGIASNLHVSIRQIQRRQNGAIPTQKNKEKLLLYTTRVVKELEEIKKFSQ